MTYLDRIVERHRQRAAQDDRPLGELIESASRQPPTRGFRRALVASDEIAVVAEIKRRSPSRGPLSIDLDPTSIAMAYETGGASCLSVLTDTEFFGGSPSDLRSARAATDLPVLRKDFTVDPRDVADARIMGADAVLLIAAALDVIELVEYRQLAVEVGLDVLVEVHDEPELEEALESGADLIGVNQRDLTTFEVDHDRAARMAAAIPTSAVRVAESGIRDAEDTRRLAAAGYDAILVGEILITAPDPARAVTGLLDRS